MAALTDLPELAARISRELDEAGIAHAISGAIAMAAHGYARATNALDILALIANAESLDGEYIREALANILRAQAPRHAEIKDLLDRIGQ